MPPYGQHNHQRNHADLILRTPKGEWVLHNPTGMRLWRFHEPSPWVRRILLLVPAAKTECSRALPRGTSALGVHLTPGLDPSLITHPPPIYAEAMGMPVALQHLTIPIHLVHLDSSLVSSDGLLEGQPSWMQHCSHRGVWGKNRWDAVRGRE